MNQISDAEMIQIVISAIISVLVSSIITYLAIRANEERDRKAFISCYGCYSRNHGYRKRMINPIKGLKNIIHRLKWQKQAGFVFGSKYEVVFARDFGRYRIDVHTGIFIRSKYIIPTVADYVATTIIHDYKEVLELYKIALTSKNGQANIEFDYSDHFLITKEAYCKFFVLSSGENNHHYKSIEASQFIFNLQDDNWRSIKESGLSSIQFRLSEIIVESKDEPSYRYGFPFWSLNS